MVYFYILLSKVDQSMQVLSEETLFSEAFATSETMKARGMEPETKAKKRGQADSLEVYWIAMPTDILIEISISSEFGVLVIKFYM